MNFSQKIIELQREVRDLKTASKIPAIFKTYRARYEIPARSYAQGETWTIKFQDVGDTNAPIVMLDTTGQQCLLSYDIGSNTMKIEEVAAPTIYVATFSYVSSSRPIESITQDF